MNSQNLKASFHYELFWLKMLEYTFLWYCCQMYQINNTPVSVHVRARLVMKMRLIKSNCGLYKLGLTYLLTQKFINVNGYVDVLVREGCRPTAGALGLRFPCTGPSMCSNIRREDGYSTHNPAFCHDVYVTHTSGVKNRHQCPIRDCGVSTRANICLHGEPTAPY